MDDPFIYTIECVYSKLAQMQQGTTATAFCGTQLGPSQMRNATELQRNSKMDGVALPAVTTLMD